MKYDVSEIIKEALKLPLEARVTLAGSLLDSLDEGNDADVETAWDTETRSRLREIDDGKVKLVPWAEAKHQITKE